MRNPVPFVFVHLLLCSFFQTVCYKLNRLTLSVQFLTGNHLFAIQRSLLTLANRETVG